MRIKSKSSPKEIRFPTSRKSSIAASKDDQTHIPEKLAILPLRDTVIYPYMVAPLVIAREKSVKLIDDALSGKRIIGVVAQRKAEIDSPTPADLYEYGVAATILKMLKFPDGSIRLLIQGLTRIKVKTILVEEPYFVAVLKSSKKNRKNPWRLKPCRATFWRLLIRLWRSRRICRMNYMWRR
jgi:ATP-dependent Lon protease